MKLPINVVKGHNFRELGMLGVFFILVIIMSLASEYFLTMENIFNIFRNMSVIGIISIGMTMVIITGGIDLSVGSLLAVSAMIAARMMWSGLSPLVGVLLGIISGTLLGFYNGLLITKLNVNPFITTLGMLSIARGLTNLAATGLKGAVASNIPIRNDVVNFLGDGYIGPIPFQVFEMLVLVLFFSYFLKNTVLGREIYAVGSNKEAARLCGVNCDKVQIFVYTLTGLLCSFAGIIKAGQINTAATNAGTGTELDVIAAVVIGGTSLSGGEGTIWGALVGAAIMAVLRNSFTLLNLPSYMQTISIGLVIHIAVSIDNIRKKTGPVKVG